MSIESPEPVDGEPTPPAESKQPSRGLAVARYTILRIGLFAAVWLVLELLTPLSLVWTLAGAVLMSGAISVVVLDRPRGEAGQAVGGIFRRINARIDASTQAEDAADDAARSEQASFPSGQGEGGAKDEAVAQQDNAGALEGGDESGPARS